MKKRWICLFLAAVLMLPYLYSIPVQAETAQEGTAEETTEGTTENTAPEQMTVSPEFVELLKQMEGFAPVAFWDYAQYTIGYGTRCPDDKIHYYTEENPLTEEEALVMLYEELAYFEAVVRKFSQKYSVELNQNQFDALVSFSYNCGGNWINDENGYFHTAIRSGDMGTALIYGMCLWSTAGDAYKLINRRMCEANMYINGVYKNYTNPNNIPSHYKHVFLDGNGATPQYVIHGYDSNEKSPVVTSFSSIPTGTDEAGNAFAYTFDGWYTNPADDSTRVEVLDGSLPNGTVLYARWKDPQGQVVQLPTAEAIEPLTVTVTTASNIYNGAGMQYAKLSTAAVGDVLTITGTKTAIGYLWGQFDGGWIKLAYTNYSQALAEREAAEEEQQWPKWGTVNGSGVNYRTEPSTTSADTIVGQKNNGDRVQIFEKYFDGSLYWGRMEDNTWICLTYVTLDEDLVEEATLVSLTLIQGPTKTEYVQMQDFLNPIGSVVLAIYSDGSSVAKTVTRGMTSGYSNANLGEVTVYAWYGGMSVTFPVTIVKATVTFLNEDGTVLSQAQYAYGETVAVPAVPAKEADEHGHYRFAGWSPEVTVCQGDATYVAVFELDTGEYIPGDCDGNQIVDEDDAIYLLRYVFFPEDYPVGIPADYTDDGIVNEDDAIYLLRYVFFPEDYPLTTSGVEE